MADVAVEKTDNSVVEKLMPVEEVDVAPKKEKEVKAESSAAVVEENDDEATTTENGKSEVGVPAVVTSLKESVKENGDSSEAVAVSVATTAAVADETDAGTKETKDAAVTAAAATTTTTTQDEVTATADVSSALNENGVEESSNAEAANGDATDAAPAPAEAVKRKVADVGEGSTAKAADSADVTPEKKAKLDDVITKDDIQNGAESTSTELAA